MVSHVALGALVLVAAGCALGTGRSGAAVLASSDRSAIEMLFSRTAASLISENPAALISSFVEDGVLQPPTGELVRGRSAIGAWASALPPRTGVDFGPLELTPAEGFTYAASDYMIGYRNGSATRGRQFAVLRPTDDGWRLTALSLGPDRERPIQREEAVTAPAGREIAVAVVGAFLGWLLIQGITFGLIRTRLTEYLKTHVNAKIAEARRNVIWFEDLSGRLREGVIPDDAPGYLMDPAREITESREMMLRYLWTTEVQRMTAFVAAHTQLEFLLKGISESVTEMSKREVRPAGSGEPVYKPLSADEAANIRERVGQARRIVDGWPEAIERLPQLPSQIPR